MVCAPSRLAGFPHLASHPFFAYTHTRDIWTHNPSALHIRETRNFSIDAFIKSVCPLSFVLPNTFCVVIRCIPCRFITIPEPFIVTAIFLLQIPSVLFHFSPALPSGPDFLGARIRIDRPGRLIKNETTITIINFCFFFKTSI